MRTSVIAAAAAILVSSAMVLAQAGKPASPAGTAATEIGGKYVKGGEGSVYEGGKWIEISYGRPIKRGRDLWGSGATYGKTLNADAPVWRAGANVTTRLKSDVPLMIAGKQVPAGEYSVFIDLKPNHWTLIVSTWPRQTEYDPKNTQALFGAFGYTPDKDVLRAPMTLGTLPVSIDQLTWSFVDMTDSGGALAIMWDKVIATVPFTTGT
jgi:hypothetical protein